MSSDSSDEENLDLLKEAQDAQFINDSMFSDSPEKRTPAAQDKPLPSLRQLRDDTRQYDLKVTPEFRRYVAKQLTEILDRKLCKRFADLEIPDVPRKARKKGGVKLLAECEVFLESSEEETRRNKESIAHNVKAKRVKNGKKRKFEVTDDLLKEIAVSPEDILSQKEVKHWSKRSKAPVFHYKKTKNGQLELEEPVFK